MAKKKLEKEDGLGPKELAQLRSAIRLVWQRSKQRRLVIKRCTGADGFPVCELCKSKVPKIQVDHIEPVGEVLESGYIKRMMCSSLGLVGLCIPCHRIKTKQQAQDRAKKRKVKAIDW